MTQILSHILALVVGLLGGSLLTHYGKISIEEKLNPGHLLSALATLTVGLILNLIYSRRASSRAVKWQVLLDHLRDVGRATQELHSAFSKCTDGKKLTKELAQEINRNERALSNALHSAEAVINACKLEIGADFFSVRSARIDLKEALTDDPFPSGAFSADRIARIDASFKKLRDSTTKLTLSLNEALD